MLFKGSTINKNIIHIHYHSPINQVSKDGVHQLNKCGWSICQTKWDNKVFKMTKGCGKGSFLN